MSDKPSLRSRARLLAARGIPLDVAQRRVADHDAQTREATRLEADRTEIAGNLARLLSARAAGTAPPPRLRNLREIARALAQRGLPMDEAQRVARRILAGPTPMTERERLVNLAMKSGKVSIEQAHLLASRVAEDERRRVAATPRPRPVPPLGLLPPMGLIPECADPRFRNGRSRRGRGGGGFTGGGGAAA